MAEDQVTVTVRYFAGARAAAGVDSERVIVRRSRGNAPDSAPNSHQVRLGDLVTELSARHGSDLARVLPACSFLIDEVAGDRDRPLRSEALVDVLPPFAGG